MRTAEMIFGKCDACVQNLFTLWCAFTCSPYQGTFVNVTSSRKIFEYEVVQSTTYTLNPVFAQALYDSCKWTTMEGGVVVKDEYKTYADFLNFMGADNPQMKILFEFDENVGYNAPVVPCNDPQYFCSCSNCQPSCKSAVKLNLTESEQCHVKMFGKEWLCLEVGMAFGYYGFVVGALIITSIITSNIAKRSEDNYEPVYQTDDVDRSGGKKFGLGVGITSMVIGIAFIIIGVSVAHLKSTTCHIQIFGAEWMCTSVYLFFVGLGLVLFGSIIIALTTCFVYGHLIPKTKPKTSKHVDHFEKLNAIQRLFHKFGSVIAHHPKLVVFISILVVAGLGVGIMKLEIIEQPEQLWVPPGSRSATEKDYFDKMFGPFYRIEQLIVTSTDENDPKVLKLPLLEELLELQKEIMAISFEFNTTEDNIFFNGDSKTVNKLVNITINDLCFKPIPGQGCIVESPLEFWQSNNYTLYHGIHSGTINATTPQEVIEQCTNNLLIPACMSSIGAPNEPDVVFGGFNLTAKDYVNSTALSITWLLNNYPENRTVSRMWEERMLAILYNRQYKYLRVSYSAQRSVQDELTREDSADVLTIIISYVVMFLYVSVSLGNIWPLCGGKKPLFVRTKFFLGLGGVLMVVFSVIMSVGFSALIGVRATLIISEVIPFLVLAIGVDNIFILVNTLQTMMDDHEIDLHEKISRTLAIAGPSITLASISEALAFLLGAFTKMPAVQAFAIYAAFAIFFDFLLQITCFVALMTLDAKRTLENRVDCIPCVQTDETNRGEDLFRGVEDELIKKPVSRGKPEEEGVLRQFIEKYYAPFLFHPVVKVLVVLIFVGLFFGGLCFFTSVPVGLDQQVALPKNSYLQAYFSNMSAYLAVGPPVYIVIREGFNYTKFTEQNDICASLPGCHNNSLMNIVNVIPYMTGQTYAWLDDYLRWAQFSTCCLEYEGHKCQRSHEGNHTCKTCYQLDTANRPVVEQFYEYLPWFLTNSSIENASVPICAITGEAYVSDIAFAPNNNSYILSSRLRSYHTILKNQSDYINALKVAYEVADEINASDDFNGMKVFPYSVFYIFFEQYLYIQSVAVMVCGLALAGIFIVTFLLLGSPIASVIIVVLVAMIEIDLIGAMYLWDISLNAVSVVNMVMAIGISVEFCVHITHSFCKLQGSRPERAMRALIETGSSILSGITLTKFFGVVVLAFSPSEIFEIYYFRMYLLIVLLGAGHGLVLLPVILSWLGPKSGSIYDGFHDHKDKHNHEYGQINSSNIN